MDINKFAPDFSKDAVFIPCSRKPFEFYGEVELCADCMENNYYTAWLTSNLSHLSYCPENKISEIISGKGELLKIFKERTQFAYAVKIDNTVFLIFQGSCSREDAFLDANFFPKKEESFAMHRGFSKAFSYLWPQIETFVNELKDEKLIIAGHSLGGALAYIASTRVRFHSVYTFGAPRVSFGNSDHSQKNIFRFVNCSDIVSTLPPAVFGFRHAGKMIFIDEDQAIHEDIGNKFILKKIKASGRYFIKGSGFSTVNAPLKSLVDHAPVNYSRALSRHLLSGRLEN
ncbi:MAG: lipase family protein [Lentisphaeraceae bacterium]|nr:lipase family protein [Lentisphaeraceae bacterium]